MEIMEIVRGAQTFSYDCICFPVRLNKADTISYSFYFYLKLKLSSGSWWWEKSEDGVIVMAVMELTE